MGVVVEFVFLFWEEVFEVMLKGEYDVILYGNFVCVWESEFFYSNFISVESLVFYVNVEKGFDIWVELSDLKDLKMGVIEGYLYNDEFVVYIKSSSNVVESVIDKDNL